MAIALSIYKFFAKQLKGTNISQNPTARKIINRLNSQLKLEYVLIDEKKLFLDDTDSLFLSAYGSHEKTITSLVKKEIKQGDTVLDIGAHIGYYTIIFSNLVGPKGHVYSFEPDPQNFSLLEKTVKENKLTNVHIFQNAVSDKNESVEFFQSNVDSIGNRMFDSNESGIKIQINSISLDKFFKDKFNEINFIKMDIQGAEGLAIKGMTNILQNNKKLKIIQEWWPSAIKKYGVDADSHLKLLEKLGMIFYEIDGINNKLSQISILELMTKYPNKDLEDINLFCIYKNKS